MSKKKSMDLGQVKSSIAASGNQSKVRSLARLKNLTANNDLKDVMPVGDRLVVSLKTWPAQSMNGVFMPESYTVIRGEQYVTEVEAVGEDVTIVDKGDVVIMSMYSGHHITTKTGHAKIISESDILIFKKKADMEKVLSFNPKTFQPGINNILVELIEKKEVKSEGGIILEVGEDDAFNQNDVVTKTAEIIAVGPTNEFGKSYKNVGVGSIIIIDAHVGLEMNTAEVTDKSKFRTMLANDILGFIDKK